MKDEIIVKRYTEALIGFVKKTCGVEAAARDFKNLKLIIHDNPDFMKILENPKITFVEKCVFVDEVLKHGFSEESRNFIKLLIEKKRIERLEDVADFLRINYADGQARPVLLKTAFPLELDLIKGIEEKLENRFKRKFKFFIDLDGDLLGGVRVEIGHTYLDDTLSKRLAELKEKLLAARI